MKHTFNLKLIFISVILCITELGYAGTNPLNTQHQASAPTITPHTLKIDALPTSHTAHSRSLPNYVNSKANESSTPELSPDQVVLNFENADIQSVIKAISLLSGKNFVIDPRVKGTVNIVSDKPISKANSYKVLEAALRMQGFACVESDGVIKVLPESVAKTFGMRTLSTNKSHHLGDQVVTKIYVLQHGSAIQLVNALRPLISPNNSISVYQNSNAIIVTDYASNIDRINKIVADLTSTSSQKGNGEPTIIPIKNGIASDIAQVLQAYLQGGNAGAAGNGGVRGGGNSDGPSAAITVDPMTNSLIVYSEVPSKIQEIKALAHKLDTNTSGIGGNIHVVYLKNADAAHIADVLRVVATNQADPDMKASSALAKFSSEPQSMFNNNGSGGSSPFTSGSASGGSTPSSSSNPGNRGSSGQNNSPTAPKVFIQAEPTTNSLIIQAPDPLYRNLRSIISMLDVRRAEIMIETMIVNVRKTTQGAFGIQWIGGAGNNNAGAIAVSNYAGNSPTGGSNSLSSLATTIIGATQAVGSTTGGAAAGAASGGLTIPGEIYVGLVTGTTTIGGQTIPNMSALADAIEANNLGNVITRPTLITLDNEEAKFQVGANIPVINGSLTNSSSSIPGSVSNSYTREDVGTLLDIKPLITQSGGIQLDLYQEDSQVEPGTQNAAQGPTIDKKSMRTTLMVDDGQMIAIGGMTQDDVEITQNGIPLLMDIPYLGWLFSWQSRSHTKSNIVVFLRPVIVKSAMGYKALTNNRYRYVVGEEESIKAKGNLLLPRIDPVTLENQLPYGTKMIPPGTPGAAPAVIDMRSSTLQKKNANNIIYQPQP